MKKTAPPPNPDAYVQALSGWQRTAVAGIRTAILADAQLEEVIKWGNLVYLSNGPVVVLRADSQRVMLGYWRGQRLREIEKRLKPGGKYEMATITLLENDAISPSVVKRLTKAAVALNETLGDPTDI
jgi:hypothetical protein